MHFLLTRGFFLPTRIDRLYLQRIKPFFVLSQLQKIPHILASFNAYAYSIRDFMHCVKNAQIYDYPRKKAARLRGL
jgi:hypothetical protein